jgi:ABC-2 type transport system permease protein
MKAAWQAEMRKIATVRRQWLAAALAAIAIPLTSLLVVATGRLGIGASATTGAATGSVVGLLAYGTWAATIAASEYSTQSILVTMATVPRRVRLYAAKIAAVAAVAGVGAVGSASLALLIVLAVDAPGAHPVGDPASLLGIVVAVIAVAVVGASAGMMTRSPSASIVVVLVAVLAPQAAGGLLGGLQPWIVGASPGTVITQIVGSARLAHSQTYPAGAGLAAVTMVLVAAAVACSGAVAFQRRDG